MYIGISIYTTMDGRFYVQNAQNMRRQIHLAVFYQSPMGVNVADSFRLFRASQKEIPPRSAVEPFLLFNLLE